MSDQTTSGVNRRQMLQTTGGIALASTLHHTLSPFVHAGQDSTVQVALVGCGGRGTGAAANALSTQAGPIKLVAMADVFDNKLKQSYEGLKSRYEDKMEIPEERKFISFDGYRQAMDCLKPGDIVILTTPPAFRWVQFAYAIEKGLNVFMEKPITVDGPSTRKMFELDEKAKAKNLKVAVGLMCRHCRARGELADRVHNGEIGDLILMRAYRQAGPTGSAFVEKKADDSSELLYQIKNFHGFLWASGGGYSDFLIHNIDEACWMKNDFPVEAKAAGGRHYRGDYVDQNFDTYSVEYTFKDGSKLRLEGRTMPGCHQEFATYVHGSKGSAVVSTAGHLPAKPRIFKGQNMVNDDIVWQWGQPEPNPYQTEWDDFLEAIRKDLPYSEVRRGAEASLVTAMGRMAAHTGQVITYDQMLNCEHEFAPEVDKLTMDSPAPVVADAEGKYPVPMPGFKKNREF